MMRGSMKTWLAGLVVAALVPGALQGPVQGQAVPRLQVHGHLTQGFVRTDTLMVLGINDQASADYRAAAVNLEYAVTDVDRVVLQVSHRRLGMSAFNQAESSVELDWGYYQRELGVLHGRIGRMPLPLGIYNRSRDAGTALPFYRAPASLYEEGFENLDGLSLEGTLALGAWSAELTAYYGGMRGLDYTPTPTGPVVMRVGQRQMAGGQLWLNTPLAGLRAGVSAARYDAYLGRPTKNNGRFITGSLDLARGRILARAEIHDVALDDVRDTRAWYAQASVRTVGALWLGAQAESLDTDFAGAAGTQETLRDRALALRYVVNPLVVLKLEGHDRTGYEFDDFINPAAAAAKAKYAIAAVSVSF